VDSTQYLGMLAVVVVTATLAATSSVTPAVPIMGLVALAGLFLPLLRR